MEATKIGITGWGSVSALGSDKKEIWQNYLGNQHFFKKKTFLQEEDWCAPLAETSKEIIYAIKNEKHAYKNLDPSVIYAIQASRLAVKDALWNNNDKEFGINIGSSRGATTLFEKYHADFIASQEKETYPLCSPATTLGNIASWVATDLGTDGPAISHSITCSTALHAIINAVVWITSGYTDHFLAGGSEAPLTPFTLAQMKALKIYSSSTEDFPCKAMDLDKQKSSMILGEGAACFSLEANPENAIANITGIGYGVEIIKNGASLSADATCMQKAMQKALKNHNPQSIDVVIMHSPGTVLGDVAEMKAIEAVFGNHLPLLTCNKWKLGHTFGASGALSLEMALLMIQHNQFIAPPYLQAQNQDRALKKIMINAVGFGGNAASIIIEKAG
ncbi:beta-ketoacyl synthase N-terminal-like domain-containing protein [Pedobacter arcticus]|uniref:beta-ketoacyl synthase N-terminal-like domain-containing protein n=1 Tax=Pedobacter arcticus TaxID=752140 RepID=UPI0002F1743E|nr:beta-ketoacyl synthase N-terminal-like domain-containing protein [Pedobacter arcticus]